METQTISHVHGWYNDKRMITEYRIIPYEKGNTVYTSQRWYYNVQLYNNHAEIKQIKAIGNNIDIRI